MTSADRSVRPQRLEEPFRYAARLALAYVLALLGIVGGALLSGPLSPWGDEHFLLYMAAMTVLALAPIPSVAATTLLVRDYGWTRGLWAAPGAAAALFCMGLLQLLVIAAAEGMTL